MNQTIEDVIAFVKENDVQFIRLAFCDLFGLYKNISIMPEELADAFEKGVSIDGHAIRGFRQAVKSDLLLVPDPATLSILPWRPGPGRVIRFYCDIHNPDHSGFLFDSRSVLKNLIRRSENNGYVCQVGAECEFYLFKTDENGDPIETPLDQGGYMDISPLDKGENIRREICLSLKEMGLKPEASHHEQGPGQNEIDFRFSDALTCADHFLTFKSVVKAIAMRNGLFASFMPKPIPDAPGNGMHVNLSLCRNGMNAFSRTSDHLTAVAEHFIAGILARIPEITVFLNPLINSYDRLGVFEAPRYVSWSHQNRSQLIRIPAAAGEKVRMELRSPDPSLNPYLAFALILAAGLDGIENEMTLPPPVDLDLLSPSCQADSLAALPSSLGEAIGLAKSSSFVRSVIGSELLSVYLAEKEAEEAAFRKSESPEAFYRARYFEKL
jgi:glutamine synthetase